MAIGGRIGVLGPAFAQIVIGSLIFPLLQYLLDGDE
jgi:hypothetical protein